MLRGKSDPLLRLGPIPIIGRCVSCFVLSGHVKYIVFFFISVDVVEVDSDDSEEDEVILLEPDITNDKP